MHETGGFIVYGIYCANVYTVYTVHIISLSRDSISCFFTFYRMEDAQAEAPSWKIKNSLTENLKEDSKAIDIHVYNWLKTQ